MKLKPEGVPRPLGQQDVSTYFPHGETAVTEILEGQLAFLQHVHLYEENHRRNPHPATSAALEVRVPLLLHGMSLQYRSGGPDTGD